MVNVFAFSPQTMVAPPLFDHNVPLQLADVMELVVEVVVAGVGVVAVVGVSPVLCQ